MSKCSFLVHINTVYLGISPLDPSTLLNLLISSRSFFADFFTFSVYTARPSSNKDNFTSSSPGRNCLPSSFLLSFLSLFFVSSSLPFNSLLLPPLPSVSLFYPWSQGDSTLSFTIKYAVRCRDVNFFCCCSFFIRLRQFPSPPSWLRICIMMAAGFSQMFLPHLLRGP